MGPDEFSRLFRQLADSTPDVIYMFTADWDDVVFLNGAYEEIWGQSAEAVQDDPQVFLEGVYPGHRETVRTAMDRISSGESVDIEYRVNEATDYGRWVWARGEPVTDDQGQVQCVGGFARDVTERNPANKSSNGHASGSGR